MEVFWGERYPSELMFAVPVSEYVNNTRHDGPECLQPANFGRSAVLRAATLPAIAAIVQTSSAIEAIGDETRFARYSNSLVFDHRQYPPDVQQHVEQIAAVFNAHNRKYSQVRHFIVPDHKT